VRPAQAGPLRDRQYATFLAGMLCADFAVQMQAVAVGWHVFVLDHRPLDLGLVGLALFLPTATLWSVAGVFADRHDRRLVTAAGNAVEALCSVALGVLVLGGERRLLVYLGVILVIGIARAFTAPAERSLLPSIVSPERFLSLQASYSSIRQLVVVAGPAAGGALIALSTPLAFFASAALLVVGVGAFLLLRIERVVHDDEPPSLRTAFDGLRFIFARPLVLGAISLDLFAVLFGGATALLPAYADVILHVGPVGLGVLRAAPSVGGGFVALFLSRRPPYRRVGPLLLTAVTGFGVATIVFGLSRNIVLSLLMLVAIGGTDMISVVIRNGLVQLGTPDAMRGRVNAVENVFIGASNELGAFESGSLAALVGTVPSVVIGGIGTLVVIGLWSLFFPALRNADAMPRGTEPATPDALP
jgi:MFS family permease